MTAPFKNSPPRAHFVELPGERASRGSFAIINEILAWSRAIKLESGHYLSCIHSETASRLFDQVQKSKSYCNAEIDVRQNLQTANLRFPGGAHNPIRIDEIEELNHTFKNHFKIRKSQISPEVQKQGIQRPILGIHLRGRDKYREVVPPSNGQVVSAIRAFLSEHSVSAIYLATDDARYHRLIHSNFPTLLLPNKSIPESTSRKPSHLGYGSTEELVRIDESAFLDAVNLANCEYFLYSKSNLSYFALILGHGTHLITRPLLSGRSTYFAQMTQKLLILLDQIEDLGKRALFRAFSAFRK